MDQIRLREHLAEQGPWTPPALPESIPHGDMPGDKIRIGEDHIRKAQLLFPKLLEALKDLDAGHTADDIDYEWFGNVSKAHPYQPEDRRIVYK